MPNIDYGDLDGASVVSRPNASLPGRIALVILGLLLLLGLVYVNLPSLFGGRGSGQTDEEFQISNFSTRDLRLPTIEPEPAPVVFETPQAPADMRQSVEAGRDLDAERRLLEEKLRAEEEARLREEARRRAEEERLRQERELQALRERLQSSQMVIDEGDSASAGGDVPAMIASDGQLIPVPGADRDANKAFLAQAEMRRNAMARASRNLRTDALVAEGTIVRGFLETAINTDLPGLVRAIVREDVRSLDGRRILIPKGSRLVGEYRSGIEQGQVRVFIVWNRIIRHDGVSVDIGSPGADNLGRAGMAGRVDRHWLQRYGSAIMISVIGGAMDYVAALADAETSQSNVSVSVGTAGAETADTAASNLGKIALEDFKQTSRIPPTIHVHQGEPVVIVLRRDLDFSSLYADPLQEELARLKRGGRPRRAIDPVPLYLSPQDPWYPTGARN